MKPVIKCIFLCVLLVFAYDRIWLLCKGATDGFTVARITGVLPYDARWESSTPLTEDVRAILHQKFTFLGSGGQCYAFASEDGRYVLKCFKSYRLKATTLLDKLLKKKRVKCKARLERDFTSYKLCFDQLAKERRHVSAFTNDRFSKLVSSLNG